MPIAPPLTPAAAAAAPPLSPFSSMVIPWALTEISTGEEWSLAYAPTEDFFKGKGPGGKWLKLAPYSWNRKRREYGFKHRNRILVFAPMDATTSTGNLNHLMGEAGVAKEGSSEEDESDSDKEEKDEEPARVNHD